MKNSLSLMLITLGILSRLCCFAEGQVTTSFSYKGLDTNGTLVVEGTLNLSVNTSNQVRGDWVLHKVKNDPKLGPQLGSGKLEGRIEQDRITLDLNPGWADNNVILSGRITSTNIIGTWGYYGFAGELNKGKFEAVKK